MSQRNAIQDQLLANVSLGYFPSGFIADQVLPRIEVVQDSGKLGQYGHAHLRVENTIVGGDGKYREVNVTSRSTTNYLIESHGLSGTVTESDYRNVQKPFDAEKDKTIGLTSILAIGKEKSLADTLSDTAVVTQNVTLAGNQQFSSVLTSDPLDRFKTARATVKSGSGELVDTAIMSWEVKNVLKYHPQLLDVLGYKNNRPGGLTDQELADVLEVRRLLIGSASYNSAKEGQTAVFAPIWGKHIIFGVLPTTAQLYQTSLGYLMTHPGRANRRVFKSPTSNPPNGSLILVDDAYDMLVTTVGAGYLIKDAIA